MKQHVVGKLPPAELGNEVLALFFLVLAQIASAVVHKSADLVQQLPRADLAVVQVRREHRRAVDPRDVSLVFVVADRFLQEPVEALPGPRLAGRPLLGQAVLPVPRRLEPQVRQRGRLGPPRRRGEGFRGLPRQVRARLLLRVPPERRKDLVRPAVLRLDLPRLVQQMTVETLGQHVPLLPQPLLDRLVPLGDRRLVTPVPEHRIGPGSFEQVVDLRPAVALPQHQPRPDGFQRFA